MIHKLRKDNVDITVAVCTGPGNLTMVHSGKTIPFAQRITEQVKALEFLGKPDLLWLDLAAASNFDEVPQSKFVRAFDKLFPQFDEIFIPLPTFNYDHERVWKAANAAFRPGKLDKIDLYAYEQPAQGHGERQIHGLINGKRYYVVDSEDMRAKVQSIDAHVSQTDGRKLTLSGTRGVMLLAEQRGSEIDCEYAEVVYPIKQVIF